MILVYKSLHNKINDFIRSKKAVISYKKFDSLVISGEFYFPNIKLDDGSLWLKNIEESSLEFMKCLQENFLCQIIDNPTFKTRNEFTQTLDLVIVDDDKRIFEVSFGPLLDLRNSSKFCF